MGSVDHTHCSGAVREILGLVEAHRALGLSSIQWEQVCPLQTTHSPPSERQAPTNVVSGVILSFSLIHVRLWNEIKLMCRQTKGSENDMSSGMLSLEEDRTAFKSQPCHFLLCKLNKFLKFSELQLPHLWGGNRVSPYWVVVCIMNNICKRPSTELT